MSETQNEDIIDVIFDKDVVKSVEKQAFDIVSNLWEPRIRAAKELANNLHSQGEVELGELLFNKYGVITQTIFLNGHDVNRFAEQEAIKETGDDIVLEDMYICVRHILQASAQADTLKQMKEDGFFIYNDSFSQDIKEDRNLNTKEIRHIKHDRDEMFYRLMLRENIIRTIKGFDPLLNKEDAYLKGYSEVVLNYGLMLRLNIVEHMVVADRNGNIVTILERNANGYNSEVEDEGKSLNPKNQESSN